MVHNDNMFVVLKLDIYMCSKFLFNNDTNLFINSSC